MKNKLKLLVLGCFATAAAAGSGPANASVFLLANTGMFAMLQSSTSQCMAYTYDRNGNRLSQGSVTYGCFNWTS